MKPNLEILACRFFNSSPTHDSRINVLQFTFQYYLKLTKRLCFYKVMEGKEFPNFVFKAHFIMTIRLLLVPVLCHNLYTTIYNFERIWNNTSVASEQSHNDAQTLFFYNIYLRAITDKYQNLYFKKK